MTGNEYQKLAARTINQGLTFEEQKNHALHGMVGEIGEMFKTDLRYGYGVKPCGMKDFDGRYCVGHNDHSLMQRLCATWTNDLNGKWYGKWFFKTQYRMYTNVSNNISGHDWQWQYRKI